MRSYFWGLASRLSFIVNESHANSLRLICFKVSMLRCVVVDDYVFLTVF